MEKAPSAVVLFDLASIRVDEGRVLHVPTLDDLSNGQPVLLRKCPVALVMGGHRHNGARAIAHQHVVGNPDRKTLAGHRVDGIPPVNTPVFSLSNSCRCKSLLRAAAARYSATTTRCPSDVTMSTSGCSGASTM